MPGQRTLKKNEPYRFTAIAKQRSVLLSEQNRRPLEIEPFDDCPLFHGQKFFDDFVLGHLLNRGFEIVCFRIEILAVVGEVLLHD